MFGMSLAEIAVILVLALVILGPEKLPELARTLGKTLREVRRAGNQIRDAIMMEDELREFRESTRSITTTGTTPAAGYANVGAKKSPADEPDFFDGPLDQIDEEEWGIGGSLTYDPNDYHAREKTNFEINMHARGEMRPEDVREVELEETDFAPPGEPDYAASSIANPFDTPHVDVREVHIHEQYEG